jgi:hypothetical protein
MRQIKSLKSLQTTPTFMNFMEASELEIAQQITLIEFSIFSKLKPSELLDQAWTKQNQRYRSPRLIALIERANVLSYWVSTMVSS